MQDLLLGLPECYFSIISPMVRNLSARLGISVVRFLIYFYANLHSNIQQKLQLELLYVLVLMWISSTKLVTKTILKQDLKQKSKTQEKMKIQLIIQSNISRKLRKLMENWSITQMGLVCQNQRWYEPRQSILGSSFRAHNLISI